MIEFFSENLSLKEHHDEHVLDFAMQPQQILPADKLMLRASDLRLNAGQGFSAALQNGTQMPEVVTPIPADSASESTWSPQPILPLPD